MTVCSASWKTEDVLSVPDIGVVLFPAVDVVLTDGLSILVSGASLGLAEAEPAPAPWD